MNYVVDVCSMLACAEEARASLQRSLMEVEKGLVQWKAELNHAKEVISYWEERSDGAEDFI